MIPAIALRQAAHLRWSSDCNVVWDGNSLVSGTGSTGGQTIPVQVSALSPLSGSGIAAATNAGIGGQRWDQMTSTATDVDAAWVSGKKNVLICWETTNFLCNTANTPAGCLSAIQAYTAARRAAHPWIIVCLTTIPRETAPLITDQTTRSAKNAEMVAVDAALLATPSVYGFDAVVDVRRAGSPFAFTGYATADFDASGAIWSEASGSRVHLNNSGYAIVSGYVADDLNRLPKTPH